MDKLSNVLLFDAAARIGATAGHRNPKVLPVHERQDGAFSNIVRRLVLERDAHRCTLCGSRQSPLHIDHVTPWSVGGSGRSDNLRVLCGSCNASRRNYREVYRPRIVGVTDACDPCAGQFQSRVRRIPVYCGQCHSTSWVLNRKYVL